MNPIIKYFYGEKAESYIFILIGFASLLISLYFMFGLKNSFWKGIAIPFIFVAFLEIIVGYTIVTRSPKDLKRVEMLKDSNLKSIKTQEIPRMENVMSNFVIYRYVEIALILLGLFFMYSSTHDTFWRGIGLGLFVKASIVLILDFFAERRGHIYLEYLKELVDKL